MLLRARIFLTQAAALTAKAALDPLGTKRCRVTHEEGTHLRGFRIANPGNAASRLRARGIITRMRIVLFTRPDGLAWALPEPFGETLAGAVDLPTLWRNATHEAEPPPGPED